MKKRVLHWVLPMHISETVHSVKQMGRKTDLSPLGASACFGAIFGHFAIILVFFSEAVFQHGFGTVFS